MVVEEKSGQKTETSESIETMKPPAISVPRMGWKIEEMKPSRREKGSVFSSVPASSLTSTGAWASKPPMARRSL